MSVYPYISTEHFVDINKDLGTKSFLSERYDRAIWAVCTVGIPKTAMSLEIFYEKSVVVWVL